MRVRGTEEPEQLQHGRGPRPGELLEHRLHLGLLLLGQLGLPRRDPDRDRGEVAKHPHPRVAQRAADEEPPPDLEIGALRKGPIPNGIVLEGDGQEFGHGVEIGVGGDAGVHGGSIATPR